MQHVKAWIISRGWRLFACLLAIGATASLWVGPSSKATLLELLRIIVSWPVAITVLGFALGWGFRQELSKFISDIASVRGPGGWEVQRMQQPSPSTADADVINIEGERVELERQIHDLAERANAAERDKVSTEEAAIQLLTEKDREATYWHFMYLSLFLVPATKQVLYWFAQHGTPLTREYYHETWRPLVASPRDREVMMMVLLQNGLLQEVGSAVQISEHGRGFLQFIGAYGHAKAEG